MWGKARRAKRKKEKGRGKEKEDKRMKRAVNRRTGKGRDGKRRDECEWRKRRGVKNALPKTEIFYQIFNFGKSCTHLHPRSGPNLARKCGPTVTILFHLPYQMPLWSAYTTKYNHTATPKVTDVGIFFGVPVPTPMDQSWSNLAR